MKDPKLRKDLKEGIVRGLQWEDFPIRFGRQGRSMQTFEARSAGMFDGGKLLGQGSD